MTLDNSPDSPEGMLMRLDSVNLHFKRKAASVMQDMDAVLLLAQLYKEQKNIPIDDESLIGNGIRLAKLAAANFVDIGSEFIYITPAGCQFIYQIEHSPILGDESFDEWCERNPSEQSASDKPV